MEKTEDNNEIGVDLRFIVKSSFVFFLGILLMKIISYVYRIIIAREFGPENYGLFSIGLMIAGWFMSLSAFGLNEGLNRYLPRFRGDKNIQKIRHVFKFSILFLIITSSIAGITLFSFAEIIATDIFDNVNLIIFLKFFSLLVPLVVVTHPFLALIRSYEKIQVYSFIFNILQSIVKISFLFAFILIGWNSEAIIFSYLLGAFSVFLASYLYCKYKLPQAFNKATLERKEKKILNREFLSYSWPLLFSSVVATMFYWVDTFLLGYFRGVIEVGVYNAALPIALLLSMVPELFILPLFPIINREYANKRVHVIKDISRQVGKWILVLNLPVFIILILFPGAVINIIFGSEYLLASNALRILSVGMLFSSVFLLSQQLISMLGKSRFFPYNIIFAIILNIILNYKFIPLDSVFGIDNSGGLVGAAMATLISTFFLNLLFIIQAKKYLDIIPLDGKAGRIIVVAIISAIFLYFLKSTIINGGIISLFLVAFLFLVIYISLIFVMKCLDEEDFMILKAMRDKFLRKDY
ncbi:hypothetical protein COU54_04480 [Candidatus Pacearchaeota archaeon CG10_big_fil_rev_8_21_14_0_10_31_24]|nr:MAG: hypothetical protein COU54_04480 [Candidatus Pacearchaeota archaeon CG10_big_fil_rev_8_21_14_0_10_31_24]